MALIMQHGDANRVIPISAQYNKLKGAERQGLSQDDLLRASFIEPQTQERVSFAQAGLLYVNAMVELDDQFIGLGRRVVPASRLALLLRVMIGNGTLATALGSAVRFHERNQPILVHLEVGGLESALSVYCDDAFAGDNAPLIEDIYLQSIFGGLSYFLGRPFPATGLSTRNPNNPAIGIRHYSMLHPLELGHTATIHFPTRLMAYQRQAKPTDDIYWSVCENWLTVASGISARTDDDVVTIRGLSTKALCSELGISPAKFRRMNSFEGRSFRRFREETLVEVSLALLADSSRSISTIAEELGYADVRSYRRFIKGATGQTPDQLRAQSDATAMRTKEPEVVARIQDLTTQLSR